MLKDLMGSYVDSSNKTVPFCTLQNGCYLDSLLILEQRPDDLHLVLAPDNDALRCVNYATSATTGGKCFLATLTFAFNATARITGSIRENRKMEVLAHDQSLCLEDV